MLIKWKPIVNKSQTILIPHVSIPGNLLQFSRHAAYAFTAGAIALLVINAFLMLIGKINKIRCLKEF